MSAKQISKNLLVAAVVTGVCTVGAAAGHMHCHVLDWSAAGTTPITLPADYRAGGNHGPRSINSDSFLFAFTLPTPPAAPGCTYEISDITRVEITFNFVGGSMRWDSLILAPDSSRLPGQPAPPKNPRRDLNGPYTFTSGSAKTVALFPPHCDPGSLDIALPFPVPYVVVLMGDNNNFAITSASATIEGHHYYLPTPGTGAMTLMGLSLIVRRRR